MEGLRVSKLEEGQQWGKNTSSKDKVHWGRRPPFIEGEKSNRYVLSPHTSGTTAPRAILPLWRKKQGKGATKHEPWGGSTAYKRYYRPKVHVWLLLFPASSARAVVSLVER